MANGTGNSQLEHKMHSKLQLLKLQKKKRYMCLYGLWYLWLTAEEWDQQTTKFIDINLPNGCFVGHKRILCTRLEGFSSSLACSNRLRIMRIELCKQKQNDFWEPKQTNISKWISWSAQPDCSAELNLNLINPTPTQHHLILPKYWVID